jgi:hypothetical protein
VARLRPGNAAAYFVASVTASRRLQLATRFVERHWRQPPPLRLRRAGPAAQLTPTTLDGRTPLTILKASYQKRSASATVVELGRACRAGDKRSRSKRNRRRLTRRKQLIHAISPPNTPDREVPVRRRNRVRLWKPPSFFQTRGQEPRVCMGRICSRRAPMIIRPWGSSVGSHLRTSPSPEPSAASAGFTAAYIRGCNSLICVAKRRRTGEAARLQ